MLKPIETAMGWVPLGESRQHGGRNTNHPKYRTSINAGADPEGVV